MVSRPSRWPMVLYRHVNIALRVLNHRWKSTHTTHYRLEVLALNVRTARLGGYGFSTFFAYFIFWTWGVNILHSMVRKAYFTTQKFLRTTDPPCGSFIPIIYKYLLEYRKSTCPDSI